MAKLIDDLKKEHEQIAQTLQQVRELGIGSVEGQQKLIAAKNSLLAHLKKEDAELYPKLRNKAASDAQLARTMEFFAKDMESVSKAALDFFAKYAAGGSGIEFAKDFGRLFITLSGRIKKEEDILYPAYID